MQSRESIPNGAAPNGGNGVRGPHRGRARPPAPMAWNRPQRWSVLAATVASVLATALLLFAGG